MIILSHRGYWKKPHEKNSSQALQRSFQNGFGIETDIRDSIKTLVISHDPPMGTEICAEEMLSCHQQIDSRLFLALNIKSDGLQQAIKKLIEQFNINNYFLFDMSLPDALGYLHAGLKVFTRHSDEEPDPLFYDRSDGVWLDAFHSDWYDEPTIGHHLDAGKKVCLVSPELHQRNHLPLWDKLNRMSISNHPQIMLCTDYPYEANQHFHGESTS